MSASVWINFASFCFSLFALGYFVGSSRKSYQEDKLYQSAVNRGDYWFDKYMTLADPEWIPMYEMDSNEED